MTKGLVYVFTGEGKGKTSAALGVATRAALTGQKVVWISFYKGKDWDLAEKHLSEKLENIEMNFVGKGFMIPDVKEQKAKSGVGYAKVAGGKGVVIDKATDEEHKKAAYLGLKLAQRRLAEKPFLLVLDEALNALSDRLLTEKDIIKLIALREETHIVLTGRGDRPPFGSLPKGVVEAADLVTECKKIKHPYDEGKLAIRGLDF